MSERKEEGIIRKALSGFYYVQCGGGADHLPGPGKIPLSKTKPPGGDRVTIISYKTRRASRYKNESFLTSFSMNKTYLPEVPHRL